MSSNKAAKYIGVTMAIAFVILVGLCVLAGLVKLLLWIV